MPGTSLRYRLDIKSYLMIGSSVSDPGRYDRIASLDDGLAAARASSVIGRVKQSMREFLVDNPVCPAFEICERQRKNDPAAPGCTEESSGCPMCRIFGGPGGIRRGYRILGAYYDDQTASWLRANLAGATLQRRSRNRIHDEKRRAMEDHLFTNGVALTFDYLWGRISEAPHHAIRSAEERAFDLGLLVVAFRQTVTLGASGSRGGGECEFDFPDEKDQLEELLKPVFDAWRQGGPS